MYVTIAIWRERIPGQSEVFPIASWSLFSLVPNTSESYALRLLEVNQRKLPAPLLFQQSGPQFAAAKNHAAHVVIDRLGKALAARDTGATRDIREKLETQYLKEARQVRYELVTCVFDPLERWRTGRFKSIHILATFEWVSNEPPTHHTEAAPSAIGGPGSWQQPSNLGAPAH